MRISSLMQNAVMRTQVQSLRAELLQAQTQLASGKKAAAFSGVDVQAALLLSLRNQVTAIDGWQRTVDTTLTRTGAMQLSLSRVHGAGAEVAAAGLSALSSGDPLVLRRLPNEARSRLSEALSVLNTQVGDRYLFGGQKTTTAPVAAEDAVVEALGALVVDRRAGDLGPAGDGWVSGSVAATTLTIGKNTGFDTGANFEEFGFSLVSASFDGTAFAATPAAYVPPGPDGDPAALALDFSTVPPIADGNTFELTLALPGAADDLTIRLRFTTDAERAEQDPELLYLDPDPASRLADLNAAINQRIQEHAAQELTVASARRAADMMFDYQSEPPAVPVKNPVPQYLGTTGTHPTLAFDNGAVRQSTWWYEGERLPENTDRGVRSGFRARVDERLTVEYGVRADEPAVRDTVKALALLAAVGPSDVSATAYDAFVRAASLDLAHAKDTVIEIQAGIGLVEEQLETTKRMHEATRTTVSESILGIEEADLYEVSTRILQYETRLQASYQLTARLQNLSLVNFFPG